MSHSEIYEDGTEIQKFLSGSQAQVASSLGALS